MNLLVGALLLSLRLTPDVTGVEAYKQPHIVAAGKRVAMTFGSADTIWFSRSDDGGATFTAPVKVAMVPKLMLGRRRGPRVAIVDGRILVTANREGDVALWSSLDGGKTWSAPRTINDVPTSAREGFQSISAQGDRVLLTWLDMRSKGMQLYGAVSYDGGVTWGRNTLIYTSPDGHICECCHTTAVVGSDGRMYAMWRNWLNGNRDMYLGVSADGGKTWREQKLGEGSWALNACPMDGGSVVVDGNGKVTTAWRRDTTVYMTEPGKPERMIGRGTQPQLALTGGGPVLVWSDGPALKLLRGAEREAAVLSPDGAFVSLTSLEDGSTLAAWEEHGGISVQRIGIR